MATTHATSIYMANTHAANTDMAVSCVAVTGKLVVPKYIGVE
jgi:hypothetical protein